MSQTPNAVHPHTTTKHHVNNAISTTPNSLSPPTEPTNTHQSKLQNKYKQSNKILTKYQQEHHSMSNNFLTKITPKSPQKPTKSHHLQPPYHPHITASLLPISTHHHHTDISHQSHQKQTSRSHVSTQTPSHPKPCKTPAKQANNTHLHTICITSSKTTITNEIQTISTTSTRTQTYEPT